MAFERLDKLALANIIAEAPVTNGHTALLKELSAAFPRAKFEFMCADSSYWSTCGRLVDMRGHTVAEHAKDWLREQYQVAGDDAKAVYDRYRGDGLQRTEYEGRTLYIAVPTGSKADEFIQIEIDLYHEEHTKGVVFRDWYPEFGSGFEALERSFESQDSDTSPEPQVISPYYRFARSTDIATFVARAAKFAQLEVTMGGGRTIRVIEVGNSDVSHHDKTLSALRSDTLPARRLFDDWQASSARNELFYRHWHIDSLGDNSAYKETHEPLQHDFIPGWNTSAKLPCVHKVEGESSSTLLNKLTEFDQIAGYPFAWFFFMVHGNRIQGDVGHCIAEAVMDAEIQLPPSDKEVLLRWFQSPYGF